MAPQHTEAKYGALFFFAEHDPPCMDQPLESALGRLRKTFPIPPSSIICYCCILTMSKAYVSGPLNSCQLIAVENLNLV